MSVARKCDICGRLYEKYTLDRNKTLGFLEGDHINAIGFMCDEDNGTFSSYTRNCRHMCPECMDAVVKLLEERKSGS